MMQEQTQVNDMEQWLNEIPSAPVFMPTSEEFSRPVEFIRKLCAVGQRQVTRQSMIDNSE
jgi:hypothetical protein